MTDEVLTGAQQLAHVVVVAKEIVPIFETFTEFTQMVGDFKHAMAENCLGTATELAGKMVVMTPVPGTKEQITEKLSVLFPPRAVGPMAAQCSMVTTYLLALRALYRQLFTKMEVINNAFLEVASSMLKNGNNAETAKEKSDE